MATATNTPGTPGVLDCVVLGTIHMHVKTGVPNDIIELVVNSFTEEEILSAKTELIEFMGMGIQSEHNDTAERTAAFLYAKELLTLVSELDKSNRMPKVVVSSDQLARVPIGKKGLSPVESVPISARMNDLEDTVKKLCESFDRFKTDNQAAKVVEKTFADIASARLGAVPRRPGTPNIHVTGPPAGSWAEEMHGQDTGHAQGGHLGRGLHHGVGHHGGGHQGGGHQGRYVSPKRSREESNNENGDNNQQDGEWRKPPHRKPRKVTYGKSKVTIEGAEAAPVDIFIGNTNPNATPEIIAKVMKQCALDLPEKIELEVLEVKCLNNLETDANPRTRCWKLTVPYRFRELMARDDLYYCGWSHRQFFPPRQNRAKRHQSDPNDPVAQHLNASGGAVGGQASMVGA